MPRAVMLALLLLLAAAPADAHRRGPIHNAKHVAALVYGPGVCGDTMAVPVRRGPLSGANARAYWLPGGLPRHGCAIVVNEAMPFTAADLCTIVGGHEFGHLAGWPHSMREDAPRGSIEWVMWPIYRGPWPGCSPRLIAFAAARPMDFARKATPSF